MSIYISKNSGFAPNNSFKAKTIAEQLRDDDEDDKPLMGVKDDGVGSYVDPSKNQQPDTYAADYDQARDNYYSEQESVRETDLGPSEAAYFEPQAPDVMGTDIPGKHSGWTAGSSARPTQAPGPANTAGGVEETFDQNQMDESFMKAIHELMQQDSLDVDSTIANERALMEAGLGGNLADLSAQLGGTGFGQSGQAIQSSMDIENMAAMDFNRRAADIEDMGRREALERQSQLMNMYGQYTDIQGNQQKQELLHQLMGMGSGGPGGSDTLGVSAPAYSANAGYEIHPTDSPGTVAAKQHAAFTAGTNDALSQAFGSTKAQAASKSQTMGQAYDALGVDPGEISQPGEKYGPGNFPPDSEFVVAHGGQTLFWSEASGEYYLVEGTPQQTIGMTMGGILGAVGGAAIANPGQGAAAGAETGGRLAGMITGSDSDPTPSNPLEWILNAFGGS